MTDERAKCFAVRIAGKPFPVAGSYAETVEEAMRQKGFMDRHYPEYDHEVVAVQCAPIEIRNNDDEVIALDSGGATPWGSQCNLDPSWGQLNPNGCELAVIQWVAAKKYRRIAHRHDDTWIAVDDAERQYVSASTLPLLADALMNWPENSAPVPKEEYR